MDVWSNDEPESFGLSDPLFCVGDLLLGGEQTALVVKVRRGYYDWRYDVLHMDAVHEVDQSALRSWLQA